MTGRLPTVERRAVLALGASVILGGCTQTSSGGNSGRSTTMRNEEPASSSSASATIPNRTPATNPPPTATSEATAPDATPMGSTEQNGAKDDSVEIRSNESFPQTTAHVTDNDPSTDGSATIVVWNDAKISRKIRVAIANRNAEKSEFQKTYRIEADAYVEIEVTKPGAYALDVGVDGDESTTIDFQIDTCNSERITVAIRRNGTVDWEWLSTAMGCSTLTTTE